MRLSSSTRLLFFVLFSRPGWRILILMSSLFSAAFGLLGPYFQKEFIDGLMNPLLPSAAILYALLFSFACLFLSLTFSVLTNYLGSREAVFMQRRLSQKLYDHSLTIRSDSLNGKSVGEIVSLYATDIPGSTVFLEQSLPTGASIFFPFVLAPWFLATFFEIRLWPMLTLMAIIIVLSFFMAFLQSRFFFRFKQLAADRIGIVNEWVQNMRTLRILGWVEAYEEKIFSVRRVETLNRIRMVTNGQAMNSISSSVTFILNLTALITVVYWSDAHVTTGTLMGLLWIVGIFLTRPFRQMPWFFTFLFDSWTSLKRVDQFLSLKNQDAHVRPENFLKIKSLAAPEPALSVHNLNLSIGGRQLLKAISLDILPSEFVTVVGEVGSGKSLLLLSLLGETGASFGDYRIGSNDATAMPLDQLRQFFTYVPQEGFIMSATLRENIAFDYEVSQRIDDQKILASLEKAQFNMSVEQVENGLDAEIGERGVNLSGGQRQRVSLARVDFHQAPIVLLDDCLSAVDVDTENKLIDDLIDGAWKDRTRILVTHRLTVLEKSDRVLFLQDGELKAQGSFEELMATNPEFRSFASTVALEDSKKAPSPPVATIPSSLPEESES